MMKYAQYTPPEPISDQDPNEVENTPLEEIKEMYTKEMDTTNRRHREASTMPKQTPLRFMTSGFLPEKRYKMKPKFIFLEKWNR